MKNLSLPQANLFSDRLNLLTMKANLASNKLMVWTKTIAIKLNFIALFACLSFGLNAAIIPVTNTSDAGAGSLRQAILDANANPDADIINITATGTLTVAVNSTMVITNTVTINGNAGFTIEMPSGIVFSSNGPDNLVFNGLKLLDNAVQYNNLTGFSITNCSSLTITNCEMTLISRGIVVNTCDDVLVHSNLFNSCGGNHYCAEFLNITESSGRSLDFYANTINIGGNGYAFNNVENVIFHTSGTSGIELDPANGHNSLGGTLLYLANMPDLVIDGFDLSYDNGTATATIAGTGLLTTNCDNLTVQNCQILNRQNGIAINTSNTLLIHNNNIQRTAATGNTNNGISVANGNNATITSNTLTQQGFNGNTFGINLSGIGFDTNMDRLDVQGNTFSGCGNGINLSGMDDLIMSKTLVLGTTEVHLPDNDGRKTCFGTNVTLSNCDNVVIDGFDLSYDNGTATPTLAGTGLNTSSCNNLTVQNCQLLNRINGIAINGSDTLLIHNNNIQKTATIGNTSNGISVTNGNNATITNNTLTDQGRNGNTFGINLSGIGFDTAGDRLDMQGNTFSVCGNGVRLSNMPGLIIDETLVSGVTEVHLPDTDGRTSSYGANLQLEGCRDVVIEDFDFSYVGTGSVAGTGLNVTNCDNLLVQNNTMNDRIEGMNFNGCDTLTVHMNTFTKSGTGNTSEAIDIDNGSNATVTNNSFTNYGINGNRYTLDINAVIADTNGDRLNVTGNTFTTCNYGVQLQNMDDLKVHSSALIDTEVLLPDTDGRMSCTGTNLSINVCDNIVLDNFDLSYSGAATYAGTGLNITSCINAFVSNVTVDNRSRGIDARNNSGISIFDNTISNNNGRAINAEGGSNYIIKNNVLTNTGLINDINPAIALINITDDGTNRLDVTGNTFNGGNYAFYIQSMPDLIISKTYTSGTTELHFPDTDGRNLFANGDLYFNSCNNLVLDDLNLVRTGAAGISWGVRVNGSTGVTLNNINVDNYNSSLFFTNTTDLTVTNNTFSNGINAIFQSGFNNGFTLQNNVFNSFTGNVNNARTLRLENVGVSANTSIQMDASNNKFSNCLSGFQIYNSDNLIISDGSVANTNFAIAVADSMWATISPIDFQNSDNISIDKVTIKAYPGNPNPTGNGIYFYNCNNSTITNSSITGKTNGIFMSRGNVNSVTNCLLQENTTGLVTHGFNNSNILNVTATNNNMLCNTSNAIYAFNNSVVDASSNYWGALDGSLTDGGSGDTYFQATNLNNEGYVNNTTTFLASENANSPIGGQRIFNELTAQLTNGQTTITVADSTDYETINLGESLTRQFRIANNGLDTMFINGVTSSSTQFVVSNVPAYILCMDTVAFDLTYTPTTETTTTSTIAIESDNCYNTEFAFDVAGIGFQPCDIVINSVVVGDESCADANDGTITVTANCVSCTTSPDDIRYSIDGSTFLDNGGVFTGLADDTYTVTVQDVNDVACTATSSGHIVAAGTGPCCDISITSVTPTHEGCPGADDGALAVVATCTTCTTIEYSTDSTNWQTTSTFDNLSDGTYTVYVRDSLDHTCNASNGSIVINAGVDSSAPLISCNDITISLDAGGTYSLTTADLEALALGSSDDCSNFSSLTITSNLNSFDCGDVAGQANNFAIAFDETDDASGRDYVESTNNVGITGSSPRTIELWLRMEETNVFNEHIINWGDYQTGGNGSSFGLYQTNGSELMFYTHGIEGVHDKLTGFVFDENTWYHIAATYDGAGNYSVYINGNHAPNSPFTLSNTPNTIDGPLVLGVRPDYAAATHSTIDMDDVRIWDYSRSQTEIMNQMNVGLNGNESGLVLYYDMEDDGPNTTNIVDRTSNNNNGIMINMDPANDWIPSGSPVFSGGIPLVLEVTDAAGNTSTSTCALNVTVNTNLTISTTGTDETCQDAADGQITATVTGGTGPYTFTATRQGTGATVTLVGSSPQTFMNLNADVYIIEIEDTGGCSASAIENVGASTTSCCDIAITSVTPTHEGCPGADDGELEISATCTTCTSIEYSIDSTNWFTTDTFANLADGTYTVYVRDSGDHTCNASSGGNALNAGLDNTPPSALCPTSTINLYVDNNGEVTLVANALAGNNSTDNCGSVTETSPMTNYTCGFLGSNTVVLTADDGNGNMDTENCIVMVLDTISPVIACPGDFTVNSAPGICEGTNVEIVFPTITDNCGPVNFSYTGGLTVDPFYVGERTGNSLTSFDTDGNKTSIASITNADGVVFVNSELALVSSFGDGTLKSVNLSTNIVTDLFTVPVVAGRGLQGMSIDTDGKILVVNEGATQILSYDVNSGILDTIVSGLNRPIDVVVETDSTLLISEYVNGNIIRFNKITNLKTTYSSGFINPTDIYIEDNGDLLVAENGGSVSRVSNGVRTVLFSPGGGPLGPHGIAKDDDGNIYVSIYTGGEIHKYGPTGVLLNSFTGFSGPVFIARNPTNIFPQGQTNVTWTAMDVTGNTSECTQTITVEDNEAPTISCPANIIVNTDSGSCDATSVTLGSPIVGDNCNASITPTNNGLTTYPLGATTVIWTADDGNGQTTTCMQLVTVEDNEAPTISCPSNIVVNTDTGVCENANVILGVASVTDNCNMSIIPTHDGIQQYALGVTTVTWTANDGNGQSVTCIQTVTVEDNTDPIITCPANVTVNTDSGACEATNVIIGTATATDNCTSTTISSNTAGDPYPFGVTTITWTADDGNGQTASCSQTVTVQDIEGPTVVCKDITIELDGSGNASITAQSIDNGSSDACGIDSLSINIKDFNCSDIVSLEATALDFDGVDDYVLLPEIPSLNNASTLTIEVRTTIKSLSLYLPIFTKRSSATNNIQLQLDAAGTRLAANISNGSDGFEVGSTILNPNQEYMFSLVFNGTLAEPQRLKLYVNGVAESMSNSRINPTTTGALSGISTYLAREVSTYSDLIISEVRIWNSARSASQILSNFGAELVGSSPNLIAHHKFNQGISEGNNTGLTTLEDETNTFDGTLNNFALNGPSSNWIGALSTGVDVILTVTDNNGNTNSCTAIVTVDDNVAPIITCPSDITVSNDTGLCTASNVTIGLATATDNCATPTITNNAVEPYTIGSTTITWTADDGNGQTATCMQTVIVEDNEDPTISCPANIVVSNDLGLCSATNVTLGSPIITDNCNMSITPSNNASEPYALGVNTVIWTADDGNGQTATCTLTVTVEDNEDPTISCPANITVNNDPGVCEATNVTLGTATPTDNCNMTISPSNNGISAYPLGTTTVTWTANDGNGQTATCMQTVTVEDNEAPTFEDGNFISLLANDFENPNGTPTSSAPFRDMNFVGGVTAWYGSEYQQNHTTEVLLINGPFNVYSDPASTAGNYSLGIFDDANPAGQNDLIAISFDRQGKNFINVKLDIAATSLNSGGAPWGGITYQDANLNFKVYDDPNNTFDVNAPSGTILDEDSAMTEISGSSIFVLDWKTVMIGLDVSGATNDTVVLVFDLEKTLSNGAYAALDNLEIFAGDSSIENIAPQDTSYQCLGDLPIAPVFEGFDNCDANVDVTYVQNPASPTGNDQTITRTWTLTDDSGNSITHVQTITIDDTIAPTVTCPANITVNNDTGVCEATSVSLGTATSTDNCNMSITPTHNGTEPYVLGLTTITWTADDGSGNMATCMQTVTVQDNEAPTFIVTTSSVLYANNFENPLIIPTYDNDWRDASHDDPAQGLNNLFGPEWLQFNSSETLLINGGFNVYTDPTGQGGNHCISMLAVSPDDRSALSLDAGSNDFLNVQFDLSAANLRNAAGTFNLSNSISTPTMKVTAYNTPSGTFTYGVHDIPSNVLDTKDLVGISPLNNGFTFNWSTVFTGLDISNAGNGKVTIVWDLIGGVYAAFDNIQVTAADATIINICPADTTVACILDVPQALPLEALDNCDADPLEVYSETFVPSGATDGVITRTWTATDVSSNVGVCTQTITIADTIAPTITCPTDITVNNDAGLCEATGVTLGTATATDNCNGTVTITNNSTEPYALGANIVTWTADDGNGQTTTCMQTVTVVDNESPTFIVTTSSLLYANNFESPLITPTYDNDWRDASHDDPAQGLNNLFGPEWLQFNSSETILINGDSNNFDVYNDPTGQGGNYSIAMWDGGINDRSALILNTGSNDFLNVQFDLSAANLKNAAGTANLSGSISTPTMKVSVYYTPSGTFAYGSDDIPANLLDSKDLVGTNVVNNGFTFNWATVFTGLDISGATNGNVTIVWDLIGGVYATVDNIQITAANATIINICPADTTVACILDVPQALPLEALDNCDANPSEAYSETFTPTGVTDRIITRTWTATDASSNVGVCTQTITVDDTGTPMITCPADITVDTDAGVCEATGVNLGKGTASDNCPMPTLTNDSVEPYALGTTNITWLADDGNGQTATCMQTITVEDNTDPVITCPADITVSADTGVCQATNVTLVAATATDNCTTLTITDNASEPYAFGPNTVTWTVNDGNGQTATCMQTVTVEDNELPTITCPANIYVNADVVICPATYTSSNLTAATGSDNCGAPTITNDAIANLPIGDNTITWTADDGNGNSITCMQTVIVVAPYEIPNNGIDDDCDGTIDEEGISVWVPLPPGNTGSCVSNTDCCTGTYCFGLQYTPINSGILSSYTTGFTTDCIAGNNPLITNVSCVMDDNSIDFSDCPGGNGTFYNSSGYNGSITVTDGVPIIIHHICFDIPANESLTVSEDTTTNISMSLEMPNGDLLTEYPTFTDMTAYGNTPPTITSGAIAACYADEATAEADALAQTSAVDDCSPIVTLTVATIGSCSTVVRVYATDHCGLVDSVDYPTKIDGDKPVVTGTPNITVIEGCLASLAPAALTAVAALEALPGGATINDACTNDATLAVTHTETVSGNCPIVITRTYTITDICGNSEDFIHVIHVNDTTAPSVSGSLAMTTVQGCSVVDAPSAVTTVAALEAMTGNLQITDSCPDSMLSVTHFDVVNSGCTTTITRIYTILDACSNNTNFVHILKVQDTTSPVMTGVAINACYNTQLEATTAAINAITFTDNCSSVLTYNTEVSGSCPSNVLVIGTDNCGNKDTVTYTAFINFGVGPLEQGGPVTASKNIQISLDAVVPTVLPVFVDACGNTLIPTGPVVGGTYISGECAGTITYTYSYLDCAGVTTDWVFTYNLDCQKINIKAYLQGSYVAAADSLTTRYNYHHLLPGQNKLLSPSTTIKLFAPQTPFGHPFQAAPWNYTGNLGNTYGDQSAPGAPANTKPYSSHVADWVLITVRENGILPEDNIWTCAGWLHKNGEVSFPETCPTALNLNTASDYYVVLEHRNHLPVMDTAILKGGGTYIDIDFTANNSYEPIFRTGQLPVGNGKWGMVLGNMNQSSSRVSINSSDRTSWKIDQNKNGYFQGDVNQNVSTNSDDETLWKTTQNKASGIKF